MSNLQGNVRQSKQTRANRRFGVEGFIKTLSVEVLTRQCSILQASIDVFHQSHRKKQDWLTQQNLATSGKNSEFK